VKLKWIPSGSGAQSQPGKQDAGNQPGVRFLLKYRLTPQWKAQLTRHHDLQDNFGGHLAW
jgi:hypothetical protein